MMGAATISEFILARIAEDELDPWRGAELIGADRCVGQAELDALADEEREWVARVLAECEAKRRIVEMLAARDEQDHAAVAAHATGLRLAVKALASVYADHPDFDPAWQL